MRNHFITKRMADDSLFLIDIDKILLALHYQSGIQKVQTSLQEFHPHFIFRLSQKNIQFILMNNALQIRYDKLRDGVALGYVLGSFYDGKVKYMVNDLLMNLHGLAPLCIPINKTGKQAKDFPKMVEAGFASDDQLIMFPAGLCSRRRNGVIRDLDWKKTFIVKSVEAHRDVVPIHFDGRNSDFFYNLANLCKTLGIKFNIAMLYLADEMLKNRHKTFTITIGKPIPWQTFDKTKTPAQWAQYVKDIVYKL